MTEMKVDPLKSETKGPESTKHLVFQLGHELYGTPLVSIREIIKMQPVKKVPFMVPYFKGIINLRGLIVSVIDLRMKFDLPVSSSESGLLLVVENKGNLIGAVVDDVTSVYDFHGSNYKTNIELKSKIPTEYFLGIGQMDQKLVNIIDIASTITADDFAVVGRIAESSASA